MSEINIVCWNIENLVLEPRRPADYQKLKSSIDTRIEMIRDAISRTKFDILIILEADPKRNNAEIIANKLIGENKKYLFLTDPAIGKVTDPRIEDTDNLGNESFIVIWNTDKVRYKGFEFVTTEIITDNFFRRGLKVSFEDKTTRENFSVASIHAPYGDEDNRLPVIKSFFEEIKDSKNCIVCGDFNCKDDQRFKQSGKFQINELIDSIELIESTDSKKVIKHVGPFESHNTPQRTSLRTIKTIQGIESTEVIEAADGPYSQPYDMFWTIGKLDSLEVSNVLRVNAALHLNGLYENHSLFNFYYNCLLAADKIKIPTRLLPERGEYPDMGDKVRELRGIYNKVETIIKNNNDQFRLFWNIVFEDPNGGQGDYGMQEVEASVALLEGVNDDRTLFSIRQKIDDLIDKLSFFFNAFYKTIFGTELEARIDELSLFREVVSDHLPIFLKLEFEAPAPAPKRRKIN